MNYKKIMKLIKSYKNIYIVSHIHLDMDAYASSVAMAEISKLLKRKAFVIINSQHHEKAVEKAMENTKGLVTIVKTEEINYNKSLLIVLDTNKSVLLENKEILNNFKDILVIDHHNTGDNQIKGSINWIDTTFSSTCEMISELIEYKPFRISKLTNTLLLAGIYLDTNNFMTKTTPRTFYYSAILTKKGASVKEVHYLFKQDLKEYVESQEIITNTKLIKDVAYTQGNEDFIYKKEELAKIADILLEFNKVEASFVVGKISVKDIGISARSMGGYDVSEIVSKIGGGGNQQNAAAIVENSTVEEVNILITDIIKKEQICK